MTVTQRKPQHQPDEVQTVNEPGDQYQCDSCACDLTHTIRIKCADPICEPGDGVDICPGCFCAGKEFGNHKRGHAYRVVEFNSYPIFSEDWGADEELLLLKGIATQGFGNWKKIAEHVGTRTKQEVEKHYNEVYVDSLDWPLPRMDAEFNIDPIEFQDRKRRRIAEMSAKVPPPPKVAPVSFPGIHEVATFLPGRLEFEHEIDNEAEDLVKDLEFGVCLEYGGDQIMEDENDQDVKARIKWEEEKRNPPIVVPVGPPPAGKQIAGKQVAFNFSAKMNGLMNGTSSDPRHHYAGNGDAVVKAESKPKLEDGAVTNGNGTAKENGAAAEDGDGVEEVTQPPPIETQDSLAFKLTLMEMYAQRVEKRAEAKSIMFDRGLLEYKKMQAADKKRPREEREIVQRLRPFARLQTAADYEAFAADILYEALLRKRIQELQAYRRLGLVTAADIDKYDLDLAKRTTAKAASREYYTSERLQVRAGGRQSSGPDPRRSSHASFDNAEDRKSHDREATPRLGGASSGPGAAPLVRRLPAPLNLANSPSLHLLTQAEQTLCSQLRILPKPYLVIKETLVREYARRGGKLRRREARDLVKIDVNKTSRVWDFLVQSGFLKINPEPALSASTSEPSSSGLMTTTPLNGSPVKDMSALHTSPRPVIYPMQSTSSQNGSSFSGMPSSSWPST